VIAALGVAFSARRALCAPLRFDALFVVLRLRATFARFEAVFVARDALFLVLRWRDAFARFEAVFVGVFAAVRPRALPPPTLARDLDAVVLADVLLRGAAVLETVFLEVAVFFFLASDVFLAGRPRALIPPRDFEAVVFDDLAIHNSFELDGVYLRPARVSSLIQSAGKGASSLGRLGTTSKKGANPPFAKPLDGARYGGLRDIERCAGCQQFHANLCREHTVFFLVERQMR
jgi:hypothetical protein